MAEQTKTQRSEAAKKAAATRQHNKANEAGDDAKRAVKHAATAGGKAAKAAGSALKSAVKPTKR